MEKPLTVKKKDLKTMELNIKDEQNWKIYEDSKGFIELYNKRQEEQDKTFDKWIMSLAAGSFGLSFAFMEKIVNIKNADYIELILIGWASFLVILIIGFCGFVVSSIVHSLMAKEEADILALKYKGIETEFKNRGIYFNATRVIGYVQILLFTGGSLCLLLFIGKNLL